MSLATEAAADIAAVIALNPIEVTRSAGTKFDAAPGPKTDAREFYDGGIEYQIDQTLLCLVTDTTTIFPKGTVTVGGRSLRVLDKAPDQLGAGVTLTLGSKSK